MSFFKRKSPNEAPRMQCMEIWGGNRATTNSFRAPGLDMHVHCSPYGASSSGGDIYYLTSCASGRISRMLLADVAGHGQAADRLARKLRDLLRANVNRVSQRRFVESMNREFSDEHTVNYATAIVATYFSPRRSLSVSMAGHPYPIYYSSTDRRWFIIDRSPRRRAAPANLPLGVVEATRYPGYELSASLGDMFLMYSDAFIESYDRQGMAIGIQGIAERLNQIEVSEPAEIIPKLIQSVRAESTENLSRDDVTAILGRVTTIKTSWRDNLLAPIRIFQNARDRTVLQDCCE